MVVCHNSPNGLKQKSLPEVEGYSNRSPKCGSGWKNLEVHASKSLNCHKWIINDDSGGSSGKEETSENVSIFPENTQVSWTEFLQNMSGKVHSQEGTGANEDRVIGQRKKGHSCLKVTKNLNESPCSSILCDIELLRDEIRYFAEAISKQSVERVTHFLLIAYYNGKGKNDLKMELLIKKEAEVKDWGNSQPKCIVKSDSVAR